MDIHILAGLTTRDLNAKIFEILKSRDKSKHHIIIAPDRSLFSLEQSLFDKLGESCFFDIDVMSISRLSKKFLISTPTQKILSKQSGIALTKKLLIENKSKLHTFGKVSSTMGFASELFETICLYKSCNITCDDMYVTDSTDYANLKQKDIKLIYSEYEKFLKNDYTDSFNRLKLFADTLNRDNLKNTCFYFVDFEDFTELYLQIIYKIARFSDKTYITCPYSKDSNNKNIFTNKVYFDLVDCFKYNGLNFAIDKITNNDIIANNLLAYSPQKTGEMISKFTVNCFDNSCDEVKFAIADIYNKTCHSDCNFGDFAIVVPSMMLYKKLLIDELQLYHIPYYLDQSSSITEHEYIRLILNICKLLDGQFVASDILCIIKNKIFDFDFVKLSEFDESLRKSGRKGFACLKSDLTDDENLLGFFEFINSIKDFAKKTHSINDYFDNVVFKITEYLSKYISNYIPKLNAIDTRVIDQVLNKFDHACDDYKSVFGDDETCFDEFLETWISYLDATNITMPPITSNTLFIADFETSYISDYQYLYILGSNEGKLPSLKIDNGLLSDDEIARLPNSNKINPTIALLNARKVYKLFDTMQKAKNGVIISFPENEAGGKLFPNSLVKSLSYICGLQIVNMSGYLDFVDSSRYQINMESVLFNNQTHDVIINNILNMTKNYKIYKDNENFHKILNLLVEMSGEENIYKLIDNNFKSRQLGNIPNVNMFTNNSTSVSQIETYYSCPYKHFARYGLRLKVNQKCELSPQDIGNMIHEILKNTLPKIVDNFDFDAETFAIDYLDNLLQSPKYKFLLEVPLNNYALKSLKKELVRIIGAIKNELSLSSFKPNKKYLEYAFSDKIAGVPVGVKGVIDRVDIWGNKFIVIDYKTGDSSFDNYTDVASGKKLQLLVYAKAFADKNKLNPVGVFYLPIKNSFKASEQNYKFSGVIDGDKSNLLAMDNNLTLPNYKSSVINLSTTKSGEFYKNSSFLTKMCIDSADFDFLVNFAINQVKVATQNILDGDINPHPLKVQNSSACDYCEFGGLCGYLNDNDRVVKPVDTIQELKGDK